ncbi:uncharacterized protein LOC128682843 [Plodia interpunctella]|uniref:uncharacterized protein LOC128669748 n=1 Tax=Plodia interpunctella TaxID=58824 RepID=UPI0023687533|nr:uncharacterized protein LOC128669748 [Plodia interpunctella]XP_053601396.1 uncharacterized protein LOC128670058 [Plodia interpunctella]XP_053609461.1 uncharacterized protein LOC128674684 [Plodia interpunctella]XP_053610862.1 uncharacterized protein LOC128675462 [Plodia interpunctella]XP_053612812.1 uncharacterized protein LOC128676640 [Plodia interpunctella]XP_053616342.1 uncharacterized protein LOC128678659 [Plodia interpunctella]XP_053616733.1 uncharacterized protein LOC128678874 [Plodia
MVQKYKRKTKQASWDVETMKLAMEEAKKGSVNGAAKKYGINLSTLQRHIKKGSADKKLGRFSTVFNDQQESELIEYLFHMDNLFYGLTKSEFLSLVYQYAESNRIPHPFKKKTAGEDWYRAFATRHPELTLRKPEPTSVARARGFNRPQVERFFDLLQDQVDRNEINATRIYNVDETGVRTTSNKPPKILTRTGKKQVGIISSTERGKLTTIVCCCNAAGSFIPPFMIFSRKRMNPRLLDGSPPGTVATCSDSGWISGPIFLDWLRHFVEVTRPTKENKVILVMDNHISHKYLPALEYASKNNVIFISLPPHTSHRTQPLDVSVYGPLKTYFEQTVSVYQRSHVGRTISPFEIGQLFGDAYLKAASAQNAVNGFKATGIWPVNRHIFSDDDYLPSSLTDRPLALNACDVLISNTIATEHLPNTSVNDPPEDNEIDTIIATEPANVQENFDPDIPIDIPGDNTIDHPQMQNYSPGRLSVDSDRTISPSVLDRMLEDIDSNTPRPEEVLLVKTVIPECVTPTKVTPMDIRPIPKLTAPKTSRKRRAQKSEILTSTPIKEQQREIESKKQKVSLKKLKEKVKSVSKKNPPVAKKGKKQKASTSNTKKITGSGKTRKHAEEKSVCFICHEMYEDPPIEDWIRCDDCHGWAHEECTSYLGKGAYYCDLCQE